MNNHIEAFENGNKKFKLKKYLPIFLIVFLVASLGTGSYMLASEGKDAVTVSDSKKDSLLTADVVNASFLQVSGKVTGINIKEGDTVKKGDVLMQLDTTDLDHQISQLQVQMQQIDIQISQAKDAIENAKQTAAIKEQEASVGVEKAQTNEESVNNGARSEDIANQEIAVQSAEQSKEVAGQSVSIAEQSVLSAQQAVNTAQTNFDRINQLYQSGVVSKAEFEQAQDALSNANITLTKANTQVETAKKQLEIANNTVNQQKNVLDKLNNGATEEERKQAELATEQAELGVTEAKQAQEEIKNKQFNIDLLTKQKEGLSVQLETLQNQKGRMTLTAPNNGKVTNIIPNVGENVSASSPVVLIETDQLYYEVYVSEEQISKFKEGKTVPTHVLSLDKTIKGKVKTINSAPRFASLRMSGENGQDDISSFVIRVNVDRTPKLLPGMTVEVKMDEAAN